MHIGTHAGFVGQACAARVRKQTHPLLRKGWVIGHPPHDEKPHVCFANMGHRGARQRMGRAQKGIDANREIGVPGEDQCEGGLGLAGGLAASLAVMAL